MKIDSTVVREGREYMVCCEYDSTVLYVYIATMTQDRTHRAQNQVNSLHKSQTHLLGSRRIGDSWSGYRWIAAPRA